MWISRLKTRGFADPDRSPDDAPPDRVLDRLDAVQDPREVDALALWAAGLCESARPALQRRLGWSGTWTDGDLALDSAAREAEVVAHPALVVEVDVRPDPPLFGRLREAVVRDPERASGLAAGTLTVRVGWQLTPDRRVVRPDLLGVRLGEVPFPLGELPAWVAPLLADIGARVRVVDRTEPLDAVAARVEGALLGEDPEARHGARRVLSYGGVELLRAGPSTRFVLHGSLLPLRWGDAGLLDRLRLAEAVLLGRPDVLVVPFPVDDRIGAWLAGQTEGDDATLEQVCIP